MWDDPWPSARDGLIALQVGLAQASQPHWRPPEYPALGGVWVCFPRGLSGAGERGDPAWAAAVVLDSDGAARTVVQRGAAAARYEPGLLALREGALLTAAVAALPDRPDVLFVNATGRDHPRRAGLALHLGAALQLPTIGITHRPLVAAGAWPPDARGATAPLIVDGETVGAWLRTGTGRRPLAVHAAWRVDLPTAVELTLRATARRRTPQPLRLARRAARDARAADTGDDALGLGAA